MPVYVYKSIHCIPFMFRYAGDFSVTDYPAYLNTCFRLQFSRQKHLKNISTFYLMVGLFKISNFSPRIFVFSAIIYHFYLSHSIDDISASDGLQLFQFNQTIVLCNSQTQHPSLMMKISSIIANIAHLHAYRCLGLWDDDAKTLQKELTFSQMCHR